MELSLSLLEEIKILLLEKNPTLKTRRGADVLILLCDHAWLLDFTFLVDITQHLNKLFVTQQGRNELLPDLLNAADAFHTKMKLFQQQLSTWQ